MYRLINLVFSPKLCNICRLVHRCKSSAKNQNLLKDGTWNPPPICEGRNIEDDDDYCCKKFASGICPLVEDDPCRTKGQKSDLMCCTDARLKQDCESESVRRPKKKKEKKEPFKSMWETLPGYVRDCGAPERLDNVLYKSSDKSKRVYYRTWKECPEIMIRKKKVCCFDSLPTSRPVEIRNAEDKPVTACEQKEAELLKIDLTELQECMGEKREQPTDQKCRKVRMPRCQPARKVTKCLKVRRPDCKRECAPYPSFSECVRDALKKGKPVECDCTAVPMQCIVFEFLRKKEKYHLPPPVPAWPPERPK